MKTITEHEEEVQSQSQPQPPTLSPPRGEVNATTVSNKNNNNVVLTESRKQQLMAFFVGLIHGSGAPGGVLGVLPAVQMKSWSKAGIYLAAFSFTSVLSMGLFSAAYGELTRRMVMRAGKEGEASVVQVRRRIKFYLRVFSSCLSILVGVFWLTLTCMGKLDEVLP